MLLLRKINKAGTFAKNDPLSITNSLRNAIHSFSIRKVIKVLKKSRENGIFGGKKMRKMKKIAENRKYIMLLI